MLLVVLLSLSLSLASSSILGNWTYDWINMYQNLSNAQRICYPDSFSITGDASAGYNITYNYTTNQGQSQCQDPHNHSNQSIIQLSLTQDPSTGNWVDSNNYSLTYFDSNDTIFWSICTNTSLPLCEVINLFDRNGSFVSQDFVQMSGCGVYLNPVPVDVSNATACNPAINITDSCQSHAFSPDHLVYFTFADGSLGSEYMMYYASPYLQIYWNSYVWDPSNSTENANMTYYYNYTTGQTSMQFAYSVPNETCIYSYQKLNGPLLSGIWYNDWQNTYNAGDVNITSVDNLYMYITTGDAGSFPFYQIQTDSFTLSFDNPVPYQYDPVSDTFTQVIGDTGALFSRNGSVFNRTALLGNWSNPQFANSTAQALGCCTPYTMSISNSTIGSLSTIQIQAYLADDMANSDWCVNNSIYSGQSVVLETRYPSAYNMYWEFDSEPEKYVGYAINMTNSNYSEIIVTLTGEPQSNYPYGQNCSFTLTPGNDPNPPNPNPPGPNPGPNYSSWLSVSMIPFMFAFAVVFALI